MVSWAHQVYSPIGISIGLAVFAGLTNVTNRHTDHAIPSVATGRIAIAAMRPIKKSVADSDW